LEGRSAAEQLLDVLPPADEQSEMRSRVGLPADDKTVARAVDETVQRYEAGTPDRDSPGFALTNDEYQEYVTFLDINSAIDTILGANQGYPPKGIVALEALQFNDSLVTVWIENAGVSIEDVLEPLYLVKAAKIDVRVVGVVRGSYDAAIDELGRAPLQPDSYWSSRERLVEPPGELVDVRVAGGRGGLVIQVDNAKESDEEIIANAHAFLTSISPELNVDELRIEIRRGPAPEIVNLALDVPYSSPNSGVGLIMYPPTGNPDQRWRFWEYQP
jgi:hypothetical protein